jgi:hypothetical protein
MTEASGVERIGSRPLSQTAATSIQYDSGLPQGPAAHSTGRVEVRQTDCVDGGRRLV